MKNTILKIFLFALISFSLNAQNSQNLTLQTFTKSNGEVLFLEDNTEKVAFYDKKNKVFSMNDYKIKNEVVYHKNDSIGFLANNKLVLKEKEYKLKTKFLSFKKAKVTCENESLIAIERVNEKLHIQNISKENKALQAWVIYHSYNWAKKKENSKDSWVMGVAGGVAASVAAAFL